MRYAVVGIIVLRGAVEGDVFGFVAFKRDDRAAALGVFPVNARVSQVVDGHAVRQANGAFRALRRVVYGEVVVVVVTAEDALHAVFKPCLKQFVRTHSAEDAIGALTVFLFIGLAHRAVDKLGRAAFGLKNIAGFRVFIVAEFVDYVRPGVAVFAQRNVEEHKVVDFFSAVCRFKFLDFFRIPIDLALVDIVVFPRRAEVVAVDVAVAVERYKRLIDAAVRVFDHEHIVAESHCVVADIVLFVANARVEQAILEISFLIIIADIHARITAVIFGVVVAERERPVHAEGFHHFRENHRGVFVVERARLERYGVRDVARDHDKVGLLLPYHRRDGVHCPCVLFVRKRAAADMDVGVNCNTLKSRPSSFVNT